MTRQATQFGRTAAAAAATVRSTVPDLHALKTWEPDGLPALLWRPCWYNDAGQAEVGLAAGYKRSLSHGQRFLILSFGGSNMRATDESTGRKNE